MAEDPVSWNEVEKTIHEALDGQFEEGKWRGNNLPAQHRIFKKLQEGDFLVFERDCRWGALDSHYDNGVEVCVAAAISAHLQARRKDLLGPSLVHRIFLALIEAGHVKPEYLT